MDQPSLSRQNWYVDRHDLFLPIASAFDVDFTEDEINSFETDRDLYHMLLQKIPHAVRGPIPCSTAFAFRRLKPALESEFRTSIRPNTDLSALFSIGQAHLQWRRVQSGSGLKLPNLDVPDGCIAFLLMNLPSMLLIFVVGWWSLLSFLVSIPLSILWQRRLYHFVPTELKTVGDLARIAAAENFSVFSRQTGVVRTSDLRKAFQTVVRRTFLE